MRMWRRRQTEARIAGSTTVRATRTGRARLRAAGLLILSLTLLAPALARAEDDPFPRPKVLQPAIAFWRDIFAKYSEHQVVVHDDWYLGKVYEVLDFRPWVDDGDPLTPSEINEKKRQIDEAEQRVVIELEVVTEHRKAKAALTLKRAVTRAAVATQPAQQGNDMTLEIGGGRLGGC